MLYDFGGFFVRTGTEYVLSSCILAVLHGSDLERMGEIDDRIISICMALLLIISLVGGHHQLDGRHLRQWDHVE
jgi:hypothetical protein